MSDVERGFSLRKPAFAPVRDEQFDDSLFDQASADALPTDGRDGLPPTFRMRHDEHYVERVITRAGPAMVQMIRVSEIEGARPVGAGELGGLAGSIASLGVVQPLLVRRRGGRYELISGARRLAAASAAGLAEVPCLLQEADDDRARALAEAANLKAGTDAAASPGDRPEPNVPLETAGHLLESLATIESCLGLFPEGDRALRERVGLDLLRAETARARFLIESSALLADGALPRRRAASPVGLAESAMKGIEAEGRLAGAVVSLALDEPIRPVQADSRLVVMALTGAIRAMLSLLREPGGAALRIRVSTNLATRSALFQIAQEFAPAPDAWFPSPGRTAVLGWPEDHGRSLGLAVARRVADLHGGRLEAARGPRGGCAITLAIPAGD